MRRKELSPGVWKLNKQGKVMDLIERCGDLNKGAQPNQRKENS
jgi:hypothetical protein